MKVGGVFFRGSHRLPGVLEDQQVPNFLAVFKPEFVPGVLFEVCECARKHCKLITVFLFHVFQTSHPRQHLLSFPIMWLPV